MGNRSFGSDVLKTPIKLTLRCSTNVYLGGHLDRTPGIPRSEFFVSCWLKPRAGKLNGRNGVQDINGVCSSFGAFCPALQFVIQRLLHWKTIIDLPLFLCYFLL